MQDKNSLPQNGIDRLIRVKTWVVALLVAAIGVIALYISYDALYKTALENGYDEWRAVLWPLLIDAPLVVFTLAVLVAQLMRQSVKLWAGLVIVYTVATIGFNLAHANQDALGWAVAVAAPLGLLLTTEALRHLAKVQIERFAVTVELSQMVKSLESKRQQTEQASDKLETLKRQIEQASDKLETLKSDIDSDISGKSPRNVADLNDARSSKMQERVNKTYQMLQEGFDKSDIAKELDVTPRTVERYMTMLNGKVSGQ